MSAGGGRQTLLARLFWFGVGGAFSVMLNLGPFHWLRHGGGLPDAAALAISLAAVTVIFAIWNYRVNFRTHRGWGECLPRYLAALAFCFALTYGLSLAGMGRWGKTDGLDYAIVAACQVAVSGVKFLLYHRWVYPRPDAVAAAG